MSGASSCGWCFALTLVGMVRRNSLEGALGWTVTVGVRPHVRDRRDLGGSGAVPTDVPPVRSTGLRLPRAPGRKHPRMFSGRPPGDSARRRQLPDHVKAREVDT
ncbi:hypothetical protein GCM10010276_02980 [Streptomyces longisporus]|uniref:Secreted protein n=1 Tax=Streptomyces longisporus TaxID=1948 RepID=A0ABP5Y2L4_STRLO